MCVCSFYSMCMIDCICVSRSSKHKHTASLCVQTDFLVGDAGVQREHEDVAAAFHTTNPSGMSVVPARMKPPLSEFSMEIHQHAVIVILLKAFCIAQPSFAEKVLGQNNNIQKSKTYIVG